jgi:transcriptional regulator GlxA family with amidase domain
MLVTFVLYDQMTALDLVGPYQVFASMPGVEVRLAATTAGPKRTDTGMTITADFSLRDAGRPEIIVVPGTSRPDAPISDPALLAWLAEARAHAKWTCSVCTGALVLGAAGLLRGRRATTHWLAKDALAGFGAVAADERVVFDGDVVTAAGVSAGIDMALAVVAREWGAETAQIVQLGIEYDPQPPFNAGSPRVAPPKLVEAATRALLESAGPRSA